MTRTKAEAEMNPEQAELELLRDLVPSQAVVDAGYMVVRNGQVMVTPSGLKWLRTLLPLLDTPPDPCHPTRPQ